jgi:hypothetical protein
MIKKIVKKMFERSEDTGRPQEPGCTAISFQQDDFVDDLDFDAIYTEPWVEKNFKSTIEKIYRKWVEYYLEDNYPDLTPQVVYEEIGETIEYYVNQTIEGITNEFDTYLGWIESDIDDFNEDMFEPMTKPGVKSIRNPNPPQGKDECWNTENPCSCGVPLTDAETERFNSKKENLVDWNDADKAW